MDRDSIATPVPPTDRDARSARQSRRALLRRAALALAGLAALPAVGALTACQPAATQPTASSSQGSASATQAPAAKSENKTIVVAISGGSFMENVKKHVMDPFAKKHGVEIQLSSGQAPAQRAAVKASPQKPPYDVVIISPDLIFPMIEDNLLVKLTPENIPNIKNLDPKGYEPQKGYGLGFDYASMGIAVDTEAVKTPPKTWKELFEQGAAGAFGKNIFLNNLPNGLWTGTLAMKWAEVLTGDPTNIDAFFDTVKKLKPNVTKFFTSFSDPVDLLTRKEGTIGIGWDGRTFLAEDETKGRITWINPQEGPASFTANVSVVHNGNEDWALKLADWAIDAEPQSNFANAMFYGSLNKNVKYSEKLAKRIPPPDSFKMYDLEFMVKNQSKWIERWNKEIAV